MLGLVESAIERLEEAVAQETAALQSRKTFDLKEFNDRKSHGLLELTRAMRLIEGTAPDAAWSSAWPGCAPSSRSTAPF